MEKKFVYVVNQVAANDTTHLYHVLNLLGTMRKRGWAVELVSERGGTGATEVAGERVTYLSQRGYVLRALRLAWLLVRLRISGYRLVFVRISKLAALVAVCVGRPIGMRVTYWHSGANFDIDRKRPVLRRVSDDLLFHLTKRGVNTFVTGPESMLEYYATSYAVPRQKLRLLYNDIDLRRFHPANEKSDAAATTILFVHRFSPIRQTWFYMPAIVDRLNDAATRGTQVELLLVGDGPEQHLVESAARNTHAGVNVRFLGAQANADLPKLYQQADIFIMPSYREGFPRVVIEAMAAGLPVVTTDAGGTRDVLGPQQQRYVVSKDDPNAFADRLLELVLDPDARKRLTSENISHVRRYSTESVAEMLERVLCASPAQASRAS